MSHLFLTCGVIATILQPLQTFDKDLKDLTASARHMIIQIRKDAFREKKKDNVVKTLLFLCKFSNYIKDYSWLHFSSQTRNTKQNVISDVNAVSSIFTE